MCLGEELEAERLLQEAEDEMGLADEGLDVQRGGCITYNGLWKRIRCGVGGPRSGDGGSRSLPRRKSGVPLKSLSASPASSRMPPHSASYSVT